MERRTSPSDRRVKTLILTLLGIQTRERLSEALYGPPADLLELDMKSLETLRDELRKLPSTGGALGRLRAGLRRRAARSTAPSDPETEVSRIGGPVRRRDVRGTERRAGGGSE